MGIRVKVDNKKLLDLTDRVANAEKDIESKLFDAILLEAAKSFVESVKRKTPVGGSLSSNPGNLQRSWEYSDIHQFGNVYAINVKNVAHYAKFVELGHRGVFIPALGVVLHLDTHFQNGRFMLKTTTQEFKRVLPLIAKKKMERFLKEVLG